MFVLHDMQTGRVEVLCHHLISPKGTSISAKNKIMKIELEQKQSKNGLFEATSGTNRTCEREITLPTASHTKKQFLLPINALCEGHLSTESSQPPPEVKIKPHIPLSQSTHTIWHNLSLMGTSKVTEGLHLFDRQSHI